ncbi:MAG: type II secretion system protein J [Deltaproteobacteria bacterium]
MHVKGCSERLRARRRSSGFSLLEVVIASGLLLMTITAVTLCVTSVSASGARLQGVMDADRAVRRVAERLAALPFYGSGADAGVAPGSADEDLLGAVFPHADAARNTPTARYVAVGEDEAPAGAFVSVFTEGGVDVRCVARFLVDEDGAPLEPAAVAGWVRTDGEQPPGCALSVYLSATSHGSLRSAGFTRAASASPVRPLPTAGPT